MVNVVLEDRSATRSEVVAHRAELRALARAAGLDLPRIDAAGTVIVRSDVDGYGPVKRFATEASILVGAWVNTITDDVPAADVPASPL